MESEPAKHERPLEQLPRTIGRDELNLAEFPLTVLTHHIPDCKVLVFQDQIRDQNSGETINRKLTITAPDDEKGKSGLPRSLDDDVIVALIHITKETNNFTSRTVPFSRMALVDLLGWARNGQSLRRLDESLNRWMGVLLRYEKAWWDKATQSWVNESFHIIDNVSIYDQQTTRRIRQNPAQGSLPLCTFAWNDIVFRSFQAQNLKRLDLSLYFKLSLASSKRAYRFLDKRFYRGPVLEFDLRNFACEHVGFSRDYTAAKIKEKLQPALDELERVGFLEPLNRENRYVKVGHGLWKIVLIRSKDEKPTEIPNTRQQPHPPALVTELTKRGVTAVTAAELVQQHQAEHIERKIEEFDWEMEQSKPPKKPAGYLVKSIQDDYAASPSFESKAKQQQRQEAKQAKERQGDDDRRRKQQEAARERAEAEAVAAYRQALTPEELAQHEATAIAQASEETRQSLADPKLAKVRKTMLLMTTNDYIRQIIRNRHASQ